MAGRCSKPKVQAGGDCWTWKRDGRHHRWMMSPNPSQHIWCRNRKTPWTLLEQLTPWRLLGQLSPPWPRRGQHQEHSQEVVRRRLPTLLAAALSNTPAPPHWAGMGWESWRRPKYTHRTSSKSEEGLRNEKTPVC